LPIISIISAPQLAPLLQGLLSNTDSLVGLANVAARGHDSCVRLHWPKLDFGGSSPLKTPCREADLDLSRRRRQRRLPSAVLPLLRRHRLGLPSMPRLPQTLWDVPGVTRKPGERARGNPLARSHPRAQRPISQPWVAGPPTAPGGPGERLRSPPRLPVRGSHWA
jgi:hypothetical protein